MKKPNATELQQQLRGKSCSTLGCGGASLGVVFAQEACPACASVINAVVMKAPGHPGALVGEVFHLVVVACRRALQQDLLEGMPR